MKKQILILLDYHSLFKEDMWDADSIRQFIAVLTIFHHEQIVFIDREQKIKDLLPKEIQENIIFKFHFDVAELSEYDLCIAHYHSEADLLKHKKDKESLKNLYLLNNKSNPNLSFPSIAEYIKKENLPFDITLINEKLKNFLAANPLHNQYEIQKLNIEKLERVCIVCDFNQNFFIGDSCFWFYDISYKLFILNELQFPPEEIDIYITSVKNYQHIKKNYASSFPDNVKLFNTSVNSIDFKKYDLVISEFLLYLNVKNKIDNPFQPVVSYVFPVDNEKNDRLKPIAFEKYFVVKDFKKQIEYNKKYYNKIEIKNREIVEADQWLVSQGIIPLLMIIQEMGSPITTLLR